VAGEVEVEEEVEEEDEVVAVAEEVEGSPAPPRGCCALGCPLVGSVLGPVLAFAAGGPGFKPSASWG